MKEMRQNSSVGGSVSNKDECLGICVDLQINLCGSIREDVWGLHECTEYGKVGQPDKVDEQGLKVDAQGVAGWNGLVTQRDRQE